MVVAPTATETGHQEAHHTKSCSLKTRVRLTPAKMALAHRTKEIAKKHQETRLTQETYASFDTLPIAENPKGPRVPLSPKCCLSYEKKLFKNDTW